MFYKKIIVGARGSKLSLIQTQEIISKLKKRFPDQEFEVKIIKTAGDKIKGRLPKTKGLFVKEIEQALLNKTIDIAVHSLKDLPTKLPNKLVLAAITKRNSPYDALIANSANTIKKLTENSKVATSSLRRQSQLLSKHSVKVCDLRGNIDTRLEKLKNKQFDAMITAQCALSRMGIKPKYIKKLPLTTFVPAPGQGSLGIEIRKDDKKIKKMVSILNDQDSNYCVKAERDFLDLLGGGCQLPLGAYAKIGKETMVLSTYIGSLDGSKAIKLKIAVPLSRKNTVAKQLAKWAIEEGALEILGKL